MRARGANFGFETTLAGKGHLRVIRGLKKLGYEAHIFYLWVPSAELALSRIKERVLRGGHDVAEVVVRRRYERSIHNFWTLYRQLADSWTLFDNSAAKPRMVATAQNEQLRIVDAKRYNETVKGFGEA